MTAGAEVDQAVDETDDEFLDLKSGPEAGTGILPGPFKFDNHNFR